MDRIRSYFHIVEGNDAVAQCLRLLMSLASKQNNISRLRLFDCDLNRLRAIGFRNEFDTRCFQSRQCITNNRIWLLAARIVRAGALSPALLSLA